MSAPTDSHDDPPRRAAASSRRAVLGLGGGLAAGRGRRRLRRSVARRRPSRPSASTAAGTYPFTGAHQAGIVTPAQDRLYLAAFDLTTTSRDELVDAAPPVDDDRRAAHPGPVRRAVRAGVGPVRRTAGRHRRGRGPAAGGADDHVRLRPVDVRRHPGRRHPRRGPVRPRGPAARRARRAPALRGRRPRPRPQRRRPRRPGVRRRPAGRGARHPQPVPGRVRHARRSAGRSSGTAARRRRAPRRRRRATCSGSRTARPTSRRRRRTRWRSTCGCRRD